MNMPMDESDAEDMEMLRAVANAATKRVVAKVSGVPKLIHKKPNGVHGSKATATTAVAPPKKKKYSDPKPAHTKKAAAVADDDNESEAADQEYVAPRRTKADDESSSSSSSESGDDVGESSSEASNAPPDDYDEDMVVEDGPTPEQLAEELREKKRRDARRHAHDDRDEEEEEEDAPRKPSKPTAAALSPPSRKPKASSAPEKPKTKKPKETVVMPAADDEEEEEEESDQERVATHKVAQKEKKKHSSSITPRKSQPREPEEQEAEGGDEDASSASDPNVDPVTCEAIPLHVKSKKHSRDGREKDGKHGKSKATTKKKTSKPTVAAAAAADGGGGRKARTQPEMKRTSIERLQAFVERARINGVISVITEKKFIDAACASAVYPIMDLGPIVKGVAESYPETKDPFSLFIAGKGLVAASDTRCKSTVATGAGDAKTRDDCLMVVRSNAALAFKRGFAHAPKTPFEILMYEAAFLPYMNPQSTAVDAAYPKPVAWAMRGLATGSPEGYDDEVVFTWLANEISKAKVSKGEAAFTSERLVFATCGNWRLTFGVPHSTTAAKNGGNRFVDLQNVFQLHEQIAYVVRVGPSANRVIVKHSCEGVNDTTARCRSGTCAVFMIAGWNEQFYNDAVQAQVSTQAARIEVCKAHAELERAAAHAGGGLTAWGVGPDWDYADHPERNPGDADINALLATFEQTPAARRGTSTATTSRRGGATASTPRKRKPAAAAAPRESESEVEGFDTFRQAKPKVSKKPSQPQERKPITDESPEEAATRKRRAVQFVLDDDDEDDGEEKARTSKPAKDGGPRAAKKPTPETKKPARADSPLPLKPKKRDTATPQKGFSESELKELDAIHATAEAAKKKAAEAPAPLYAHITQADRMRTFLAGGGGAKTPMAATTTTTTKPSESKTAPAAAAVPDPVPAVTTVVPELHPVPAAAPAAAVSEPAPPTRAVVAAVVRAVAESHPAPPADVAPTAAAATAVDADERTMIASDFGNLTHEVDAERHALEALPLLTVRQLIDRIGDAPVCRFKTPDNKATQCAAAFLGVANVCAVFCPKPTSVGPDDKPIIREAFRINIPHLADADGGPSFCYIMFNPNPVKLKTGEIGFPNGRHLVLISRCDFTKPSSMRPGGNEILLSTETKRLFDSGSAAMDEACGEKLTILSDNPIKQCEWAQIELAQ